MLQADTSLGTMGPEERRKATDGQYPAHRHPRDRSRSTRRDRRRPMRPFEWLLVAMVAARLLAVLVPGETGIVWRRLTAAGSAVALFAHLVLEAPRWSLVPTYAAAAVLLVLLVSERSHTPTRKALLGLDHRLGRPRPWGLALVVTLLWLPTLAVAYLLPVFSLPKPTGPWAVGSLSFELALPDLVHADGRLDSGRRTVARLWYPVDPASALDPDAPWVERPDVVLPAMAASGGLPAFIFGHLRLVRTHAAWAAPLAAPPGAAGSRWPVVTFDHGLGGFRSQNTFLVEELASHGAVVAALDHPAESIGTVLPDGTLLPYVGLPPTSDPRYAEAVLALGMRWTSDTLALLRALDDPAPRGALAPFAGALDLGRVLATGHSTGGGVAVDVCHTWAGCHAVLALDPWWGPVDPARLEAGSERPLVVVASDPDLGYFAPTNTERFERFTAASGAPWALLVLEGGGHHDVNDTGRLSPIAGRLGHSVGPVDPDAAAWAVRAVAVAMLGGAGPLEVVATAAHPLRQPL
jgi:predicted dienelactone hydrolase